MDIRYSCNQRDFKRYTTEETRKEFLIETLFVDDQGRLRADLTNDGLHLMGQGYLIWRDAIKPYIK